MDQWIAQLFSDPEMLRMGHGQRAQDHNLGMGWLYYGLTRLIRPTTVVVIGSWRGFAPLLFAKAMADNTERGQVLFIDPSMVDDFWTRPDAVRQHFARFGVTNVRHFLMTTQQFVQSDAYRALGEVGIVMIDGYHTAEQAKFDFDAFARFVPPQGIVLLHDSCKVSTVNIYGSDRAYLRTVRHYIDDLKKDASLQVFDLPFSSGVTLVRHAVTDIPGISGRTAAQQ